MHIAVRLGDCPSSDKGVRRKHGRHYLRYSGGKSYQLKSSLRRRWDVLMVGGGQGATVGTCIALSYRKIPYSILG